MGFSVVILYLKGKSNKEGRASALQTPERFQERVKACSLHGEFVFTGSFKRCERETPRGRVVQGDADAPQVDTHSVGFLMGLTEHSPFIHVWVLLMRRENGGKKNNYISNAIRSTYITYSIFPRLTKSRSFSQEIRDIFSFHCDALDRIPLATKRCASEERVDDRSCKYAA